MTTIRQAILLVRGGPDDGSTIVLSDGVTLIGRSSFNTIVVDEEDVSRVHAAIRGELARREVPMGGDRPTLRVVTIASRTPLDEDRIAALRQQCVESPMVLIGLQNDVFLDQLPEAALRISAPDATPLTQRVVSKRLAAAYRQASEARA